MTEIPEKRYYRPDELAEILQITVETVRRWIREDRVQHVRLPKNIVIPHDEFMRTLKHGPRPRPL